MNLFIRRVKHKTSRTWRISFPSLLSKPPFFRFVYKEENISISVLFYFNVFNLFGTKHHRLFAAAPLLVLSSTNFALGSFKQKQTQNQVPRMKIYLHKTEGTMS